MAIIKLLKDHNGQKKGTTGEVADSRAEYLVRVGAAEYVVDKLEKKSDSKKTTKKAAISEPCKTC